MYGDEHPDSPVSKLVKRLNLVGDDTLELINVFGLFEELRREITHVASACFNREIMGGTELALIAFVAVNVKSF